MRTEQKMINSKEEKQYGREMKILTGEKPREIKIAAGEDLWEYLDSLQMCSSYVDIEIEDILVLQSPLGRIERNLIVAGNYNELDCARQNISNPDSVELLTYSREYHDIGNATLCEPFLRFVFEKDNEHHKKYGKIFRQLNEAGLIQ